MRSTRPSRRGFTLIELVVVMAVLGLLLSLALPRFMDSLARGKSQVQQKNLASLREAIDKFYGDNGRYPDRLEDLVERRYLRAIPPDPFTEAPTWLVVPPQDPRQGGVYDVRAADRPAEDDRRPAAAEPAQAPEPGAAREAAEPADAAASAQQP